MSFNTEVSTRRYGRRTGVEGFAVLLGIVFLAGPITNSSPGQQAQVGSTTDQSADEARKTAAFSGAVIRQPLQQIALMANQAVVVKTDEPCSKAEAKPEGILLVERASEFETVIRGLRAGEAELRLFTKDGKTPVFRAEVKVSPATVSKPAEEPPRKDIFKAVARVAPVQRFRIGVNKSMLVRTSLPCRKVMPWYQPKEDGSGEGKAGTKIEVRTGAGGPSQREPGDKNGQQKGKGEVIISAEAISPKEILVIGVNPGTTQLLLVTEDDQCQLVEITVEVEVERLNEMISQILPKGNIRARAVWNCIVLEGQTENPQDVKRVQDFAETFVADRKNVKNHIQIVQAEGDFSLKERELTIDYLNTMIKQSAPHARAKARRILDTIVLEGQVPDVETGERIMEIAQIFAEKSGGLVDDSDDQGNQPDKSGKQNGAGKASKGSAKVKNHMQVVGTQQVLLRCTVAEVSKTALRELGVNGWLAGDNVKDMFVVNQLSGINPSNIGAAADALVAPVIPGANPPRVPFLTGDQGIPLQPTVPLSIGFPRVQMQLFINALRQNNLLRVLAEPNLVAISGQTATFRVGGEFAYPVPQRDGVPSVEFKDFGVQLAFSPTVLADQRIRMRIMPEVSEPDDTIGTVIQNTSVPGKAERRLETVVEVGNGQTLALAGLLSEKVRGVAQKVPGLGDIPVLGALFSSVRYQRATTELLVLVTPELVAPMNPEQVPPVPGQEMTPPNDWQLFGLGQLEGDKRPSTTDVQRALQTAAPVKGYKQNTSASEPRADAGLIGPWGTTAYEEAH